MIDSTSSPGCRAPTPARLGPGRVGAGNFASGTAWHVAHWYFSKTVRPRAALPGGGVTVPARDVVVAERDTGATWLDRRANASFRDGVSSPSSAVHANTPSPISAST